jgi:hypothetical protein
MPTGKALDEAARERGVAGETERQRDRHRQDRENFAKHLRNEADEIERERRLVEQRRQQERQDQLRKLDDFVNGWWKRNPYTPTAWDLGYFEAVYVIAARSDALVAEVGYETTRGDVADDRELPSGMRTLQPAVVADGDG